MDDASDEPDRIGPGNESPDPTPDPRKGRRRPILILGLVAVVAAVAIAGLIAIRNSEGDAGDSGSAITADEASAPLAPGAPEELVALRDQANRIVEIDQAGFDQQLAGLRGNPVVINRWASWCGPCRYEFPAFQEAAIEHGDRVAFVGLNSADSTAAAQTFLGEMPLPYPSFEDPDGSLAASVKADYPPSTIYIDRDGEIVFTHYGQYRDRAELEADIQRYAT